MANDPRPIGIFDSGVGGLTVLNELIQQLPNEKFVYLGDTARVPYGAKSKLTIQRYAKQICDFLIQEHNVKMIVVACNTATAFSLECLLELYDVPIVGVIEPGVKLAVKISQSKSVFVIGTEGTIRSEIYNSIMKSCDSEICCVSVAAPLLVPLVEEMIFDNAVLLPVFDFYFKSYRPYGFDTVILGCTHYPLLKNDLQKYFGSSISVIDSAQATSETVNCLLNQSDMVASDEQAGGINVFFTDLSTRVEAISKMVLSGLNSNQLSRVNLG